MVSFRKSLKFGPVRFTLGKRGVSTSFGVPGLRFGINSRGQVRRTVSLPGTGIYDTKVLNPKPRRSRKRAAASSGETMQEPQEPIEVTLPLPGQPGHWEKGGEGAAGGTPMPVHPSAAEGDWVPSLATVRAMSPAQAAAYLQAHQREFTANGLPETEEQIRAADPMRTQALFELVLIATSGSLAEGQQQLAELNRRIDSIARQRPAENSLQTGSRWLGNAAGCFVFVLAALYLISVFSK